MKVTFNKPQVLGNVQYKAGTQEIADNLVFNMGFKKLVQSGLVIMHPRDGMAMAAQAAKDAMAAHKAVGGKPVLPSMPEMAPEEAKSEA